MSAGAWDGDDFLRAIRKGLHNPTSGEVSDSDILGHYLFKAMTSFASMIVFPQFEAYEDVTTVIDQEEYELSAVDVSRILGVQGISDGLMPRLKHERRDNTTRYGSSVGSPFKWYESSAEAAANVTAVSLWPTTTIAGEVFRVWYQRVPAIVTAYAAWEPPSVSEFGEVWDLALLYKALSIGLPLSGRPKEGPDMLKMADYEMRIAKKTLPRSAEKKWRPETTMAAATRMR